MASPAATIVGTPRKEEDNALEKEPYAELPPALNEPEVKQRDIPWSVKGPPLLMVLVFNCASCTVLILNAR